MTPLDAAREDAARDNATYPQVAKNLREGKNDDLFGVKQRLSAINLYLASQQANAPELVERLRKRADQSGLLLSDPPKPSPDAAMFSEAADALTAAHAQIAELQKQIEAKDKALEPFANVTEGWVDADGWTEIACHNDRICDWFGPSDFRAARAAMGGGQ